ncbi:LRR receptor-like serine threonine-protein kinase [Seminavis robusta]|uniref:LRR receptor-like serine threonine-protein kinase n=1 Tax=Seminavis robusta TaxID=568900 RepID=A0A9N8HC10_9STRA|nr:LRR receptor-like serine threonine-protein kinase [Seminavis robusta]|eukprot:Sro202_g085480.1 LRR receptor-like serine threonine-protein kinase (835) ;mRNA; f:64551-67055
MANREETPQLSQQERPRDVCYDEEEAALKGLRESVLSDLGMAFSAATTGGNNLPQGAGDEENVEETRESVLSELGFDGGSSKESIEAKETNNDEALLKDVRMSILSSLGIGAQCTSDDNSVARSEDYAQIVEKEKEKELVGRHILGIGTTVPANNVNSTSGDTLVDDESTRAPLPPVESLQHSVLARALAKPGAVSVPGTYYQGCSGALQANQQETLQANQQENETETEEDYSSQAQTDHHRRGTEGLVVANVVMDASGPTLHQAEEVTPEELQRNKRHSSVAWPLTLLLAAGFVGIAVLVVVLVLVLRKDSDEGGYSNDRSNESTSFPKNETSSPIPMTAGERVMSLLPNFTVSELHYGQSPQKRAFKWIIEDPLFDNYTDHRILQRYALATFYYATGGGTKSYWYNEDHWLSYDHHECDWWSRNTKLVHFYTVDMIGTNGSQEPDFDPCEESGEPFNSTSPHQMEEGGNYRHLWLGTNQLGGTLPDELSLLSTLKSAALLKNEIQGSIPSRLSKLTELEALFLDSNELSGSLPTELGTLPTIRHIWTLANFQLGGTIPTEIAQLSTLKELLIDSSNLTGQIPSELGLMSNLEFFWAWSNPLTGTLPTELGLMTSMRRFGLWNCTLSGSIPTEMGMMESMDELAFDDNPKMVGTIPSELGMLSKLTTLHFGGTSLTGTIPTEITQLPLGSLFLHNSGLSGSLPSELGLLSGLWRLWLFNSSFTGTLATEFGSWQSLEYMRLQNNQFSGQIPSEIGRFENLTELLLHDNFFTGTVPKELGLLQKLTTLSVSNNSLTGSIDPALCELGSWLTEGATGIQVDCDLVDCSCGVCVCD